MRRWGRAEWVAFGHLFCVVLALVAMVRLGPLLVDFLGPPRDRVVDFFQDWASARNSIEGLAVYTDQDVTVPRYLGLPGNPSVEVNAHPPTAVLLALPLARLSYPHAVLAWNLVSLACLILSLGLLIGVLRLRVSVSWLAPTIALLLICDPLYEHVYQGQLTLLLLLLLTIAWWADRSGRPLTAGVLVGSAAAIKLFPAFLFLYFAARGRWRSIASGVLTVATLTAITAALLGPGVYVEFFRNVLPRTVVCRSYGHNASIAGFWSRLFDPGTESIAPLWSDVTLARRATLLSSVLIAMLVLRAIRRSRFPEDGDRMFGLAMTAMLLVSPVTWNHSLLLLLVPWSVAWRDSGARMFVRGTLVVIFLAVWLDPGFFDQVIRSPDHFALPAHALTVLSFKFYTLLAMLAVGMNSAGARPSRELSTVQIHVTGDFPDAVDPRGLRGPPARVRSASRLVDVPPVERHHGRHPRDERTRIYPV